MVVFEYIDWTQRVSTQRISSVRLELGASQTEIDLTKILNDFTMQVTGLPSRPDIWPEPNTSMSGFGMVFSYLHGQDRTIDIALSSLGVLAISFADATVQDHDAETAARRIDNYSVVVSHLIRRCLGEQINSREIQYRGGASASSTKGYHVHRTDALPIPLHERSLGSPDNRASTLLYRNTLPSRKVRQDRNAEARSTVSNALVALTQRRLRLRDKVIAAVERYSESYADSFATAGLYSNLVTSSLALCGILLGILFSDTLFGNLGSVETRFLQFVDVRTVALCLVLFLWWLPLFVRWLSLFLKRKEVQSPERGIIGTRLFWGAAVTTGFIFSAFLAFNHLDYIENLIKEDRPSPRFQVVFIFGFALWCSAALLFRSTLQLFEQTGRSDYPKKSRSKFALPRLVVILMGFSLGVTLPGLVGTPLFPGHSPELSRYEAAALGYCFLIIVLVLFWTVTAFQTEAEKWHQLTTNDQVITPSLSVDDLVTSPRVDQARKQAVLSLTLAPVLLLGIALSLALFNFFDYSGSNLRSGAVTYKGIAEKIGWGLPVLCVGILAELMSRFANSGSLTLIHDVTLSRLNRIKDLVAADKELIARLKADESLSGNATFMRELEASPEIDQATKLVDPQITKISSLKEAVKSSYLRRSAVIAASVFAVLQIPAIRQLEPDGTESSGGTTTVALSFVDDKGNLVASGTLPVEGGIAKLPVQLPTQGVPATTDLRLSTSDPGQEPIVLEISGDDPTVDLTINVPTPTATVAVSVADSDGNLKSVGLPSDNGVAELPMQLPSQALEITTAGGGLSLREVEGHLTLSVPERTLNVLGPFPERPEAAEGDEINLVVIEPKMHISTPDQEPITLAVSEDDPTVDLEINLPEPTATVAISVVDSDGNQKSVDLPSENGVAELPLTLPAQTLEIVSSEGDFSLQKDERQLTLLAPERTLNVLGPFSERPVDSEGDEINLVVIEPEIQISTPDQTPITLSVGEDDPTVDVEINLPELSPPPIVIVSLHPQTSAGSPSSPKNTLVLPLFPGEVPANNEEEAFNWGLKNNLVNPKYYEGSTLLETYFAPFDDCMLAESVGEAKIVIDVMGLASSSWNKKIDPEFYDANLALAEGRRIAFLRLLNKFTAISTSSIFVRVYSPDKTERLQPLREFAEGVKNWVWTNEGLVPAGFQRFANYSQMKNERDRWMSSVPEDADVAVPFEELFGRSVVFQIISMSGTNCDFSVTLNDWETPDFEN
ncbi:hypothetical protein KUW17_18895 [Leisingera aquaemixtae]|uniref:hypothetical protein n=1 Tax=Leisingera aquaemixtae TaxID=1396826 RepID=UPI001C93A939|nr:hypothetical protein [Leisingera aquaemixtae]MBY6068818.1 hypothetical protein [Leisingera aquaemixtae]